MEDFREYFRTLARCKQNTVSDHFQLCLLRAMAQDKYPVRQSALHFLNAAFTPITNKNKLDINQFDPFRSMIYAINHPNAEFLDVALSSEEEKMIYNRLVKEMWNEVNISYDETFYSYILVNREVLSHEQIAVQTGHVMFDLGQELAEEGNFYPELNFVLIGSENEEALLSDIEYINSCGYEYMTFREPDLNNTLTAVASYPVRARKKQIMSKYKVINFKKEEKEKLNREKGLFRQQVFSGVSDLTNS